jgi:hypothetical protein
MRVSASKIPGLYYDPMQGAVILFFERPLAAGLDGITTFMRAT